MPLTVCRCCGGKMEPDEVHRNPNVCASCERLLEDESPVFAANMAKIKASADAEDLLDQPDSQPEIQPRAANTSRLFPTRKADK